MDFSQKITSFLLLLIAVTSLSAQYPPKPIELPSPPSEETLETPPLSPQQATYSGQALDPSLPVTLTLLSPQEQEILPSNQVDINFQLDNYLLAPGGNRLHIIIDNHPPFPLYDLREPLTLTALSQGGHTIRAYPVTPEGHMLKNPEAFVLRRFFIRKKNFQNYVSQKKPILTVNLPAEGTLDLTPTSPIPFDFYISNLPPHPQGAYFIHYQIHDQHEDLPPGQSPSWKNLPSGRYQWTAQLITQDHQPVPGILNTVKRSLEIRYTERAEPWIPPLDSPDPPEETSSDEVASSF